MTTTYDLHASLPTIAGHDPRMDLNVYDDTISALDQAQREVDLARRDLDRARRAMEAREASLIVAGLPGKNEAERKAYLVLALLDDGDYRDADCRAQETAEAMRDAERQVRVLTERCRLLRAALVLSADGR